jgi:hypothetical protein
MEQQQHHPSSNAEAIADSKIPPGDDYEEIREQVRCGMRCADISTCS